MKRESCVLTNVCGGSHTRAIKFTQLLMRLGWFGSFAYANHICTAHSCMCFCFSQDIPHTPNPVITLPQSRNCCGGLPKLLWPAPSCAVFSVPRGPRFSRLASAHRVYVLCNCRPQSEQEASVCQNRLVFPSSKAWTTSSPAVRPHFPPSTTWRAERNPGLLTESRVKKSVPLWPLQLPLCLQKKTLFNTHAHAQRRYMLKYPNTLFLIHSP